MNRNKGWLKALNLLLIMALLSGGYLVVPERAAAAMIDRNDVVGAQIDESNPDVYLYVATNGSDEHAGTEAEPYASLNKAAAVAVENQKNGLSTKILIKEGTYYPEDTIRLYGNGTNNGKAIIIEGQGNVVFSGSQQWNNWQKEAAEERSIYYKDWTYKWGFRTDPFGDITPQPILRKESVRVNNEPLLPVLSYEELKPGTFYVSETEEKVFVYHEEAANLNDAKVEVSETPRFLGRNGNKNTAGRLLDTYQIHHLVLRNLKFEKASGAVLSAVEFYLGSHLLLEDMEVSKNHYTGIGVIVTDHVTLRRVEANDNGGKGMAIYMSKQFLQEDNETSRNNWLGSPYNWRGWDPAGVKYMYMHEAWIKNHVANDNLATGIWPDTDIMDTYFDNSVTNGNLLDGYMVEANLGPVVIKNAEIRNNQRYGIYNSSSEKVTVDGADISDNTLSQIMIYGDGGKGRGTLSTDYDLPNFETNEDWNSFPIDMTIKNSVVSASGANSKLFGYNYNDAVSYAKWISTLQVETDNNTYSAPFRDQAFLIVDKADGKNARYTNLEGWKSFTGVDEHSNWEVKNFSDQPVPNLPDPSPGQYIIQASKGTPVIDGELDELWNTTTSAKTERKVHGDLSTNALGEFRLLWDNRYLYFYVDVTDKNSLFAESAEPYKHDSVELFLDQNYGRTTAYEADDAQYRVNFEGLKTGGGNWLAMEDAQTKLKEDGSGYYLEGKIRLNSNATKFIKISDEQLAASGMSRTIELNGADEDFLGGKYFIIQQTSGSGESAEVDVNVTQAAQELTVPVAESGARMEVWLVDDYPNMTAPALGAGIFAHASTEEAVQEQVMGFDLQVADENWTGTKYDRTGLTAWYDTSDRGWQSTSGWGYLRLVEQAVEQQPLPIPEIIAALESIHVSETPPLLVGHTDQLEIEGLLNTGEAIDLSKASIVYGSSNKSVLSVSSTGEMEGLMKGTAEVSVRIQYEGVTRSATATVLVTEEKAAFEMGSLSPTTAAVDVASGTITIGSEFSDKMLSGAQLAFHYVDFGTAPQTSVRFKLQGVAPLAGGDDYSGGKVEVRLDDPASTPIGTVNLIRTATSATYTDPWDINNSVIMGGFMNQLPEGGVSGKHTVYLKFVGKDGNSVHTTSGKGMGRYFSASFEVAEVELDRVSLQVPNAVNGAVYQAVLSAGVAVETSLAAKMNDGTDAEADSVTYSSSNPAVAAVDSNGVITGDAPGTATITVEVTKGEVNKSSSISVKVTNVKDAFTSTFTTANYDDLSNFIITNNYFERPSAARTSNAWVEYGQVDFGEAAKPNMTFKAKVAVGADNAGGRIEMRLDSVNGPLAGALTIESSGGWGSANGKVNTGVIDIPITGKRNVFFVFVGTQWNIGQAMEFKVEALSLSEAVLSTSNTISGAVHAGIVTPGQTVPTNVTVKLNTGEAARVTEAVYSSSNPAVATVDENGIITGVAAGQVTITADITASGMTTTATALIKVAGAKNAYSTTFTVNNHDNRANITPNYNTYFTRTAVTNNGVIAYGNVDFGATEGPLRLKVNAAVNDANAGGKVELRLGSADGPLLGTAVIASTGGFSSPAYNTAGIDTTVTGKYDIYFVLSGTTFSLGNIYDFRIEKVV